MRSSLLYRRKDDETSSSPCRVLVHLVDRVLVERLDSFVKKVRKNISESTSRCKEHHHGKGV